MAEELQSARITTDGVAGSLEVGGLDVAGIVERVKLDIRAGHFPKLTVEFGCPATFDGTLVDVEHTCGLGPGITARWCRTHRSTVLWLASECDYVGVANPVPPGDCEFVMIEYREVDV